MSGHIKRLNKGHYEITIELGLDPSTKKRKRMKRVFKGTASDAKVEMDRLLRDLCYGVDVGHGLTVQAYLEKWLDVYVTPKLAAKSIRSYSQLLRMHVIPYLGAMKLENLNPLHLQQHVNRLLKSGRKDGREGGLSYRTVQYTHRVLHKALSSAVAWQLLSRNPASAVALPPRPPRVDMTPLTEEQTRILLMEVAKTRFYGVVFVAIMTGLRRGEVLGLRWCDVNAGRGVLEIRQTVQYTPEQGVYFKAPKTALSNREVPVSDAVFSLLEAHRKRQVVQRVKIGELYNKGADLVFCQDDGNPLHPDTITGWFPAFLRRIGLPPVRFHDLRHTHATLLLEQGVTLPEVSDRLGHADIRTTQIYSHVLPKKKREIATKLDHIANGHRAP